jgi:hypothetical protein
MQPERQHALALLLLALQGRRWEWGQSLLAQTHRQLECQRASRHLLALPRLLRLAAVVGLVQTQQQVQLMHPGRSTDQLAGCCCCWRRRRRALLP